MKQETQKHENISALIGSALILLSKSNALKRSGINKQAETLNC